MDKSQPALMMMDEGSGVGARETRISKLVGIGLSSAMHKNVRVVVRNLSLHGIGARGDVSLLPCERITVHLPSGRNIGAMVRWVRKNTFGLLLDEQIDPQDFQPHVCPAGTIVPRDANLGFQRMYHQSSTARSGFQRSHRDEVLRSSNWTQS